MHSEAGRRTERFLAPTPLHVIRVVLTTHDASVRLTAVALTVR